MHDDEQPVIYFIMIGAALSLGAITAVLVMLGAGILTAIAFGLLVAIFGAVIGWIWASQG